MINPMYGGKWLASLVPIAFVVCYRGVRRELPRMSVCFQTVPWLSSYVTIDLHRQFLWCNPPISFHAEATGAASSSGQVSLS